jgi:outer membrane protein
MTALSTLGRRGGVPLVALAALLAAQPLAAQIAPQPARPASPPAAALATPVAAATGPWGLQRAIDYAL